MDLSQAIHLLHDPLLSAEYPARWADLGCGAGLFTYALANVLPEGTQLYAIDQNEVMWEEHSKPTTTVITKRRVNFVDEKLGLTDLDGILMANSLHYVKDKITCIHQLSKCLKENGRFLIVEYDTDTPNPWVPYPISYASLKPLFETVGFSSVIKLNERPSRYGRARMYAAMINR